jgi:1-acyl-sn-glycerol-3-phosphate acyltransferase
MVAFLRSVVFSLFFYAGTVVAVTFAPLAALFGEPVMRRYGDRWMRFHGWCARVLLGIHSRVEGNVPVGNFLYAAKHQSMYETMELVGVLGGPAVLVKQELARIPAWGWAARRWGVIPVDRDGSAKALRTMLGVAQAVMAAGRPIMIFPEGTRVPVGEMPPLRAGFAGLYRALNVPVVPIALDSGRVWPRGVFVKHPGVITFRFGDPIPAGLPRKEAEARVHAAINALETPPV